MTEAAKVPPAKLSDRPRLTMRNIQTKRNLGSYHPKLDEEEVPEAYCFNKTLQRV